MDESNEDSNELEIQQKDTDKVDLESAENDAEEDFEPTIDMLMTEFHDETTIEEEEKLDQDLDDDELNDLTAEQEMPLEELMKLYGRNQTENICVTESDKEEEKDLDKEAQNEKSGSSPNSTKSDSIKRKLPLQSSFPKKPKLGICSYNQEETDSGSSESDNDDTDEGDTETKLNNDIDASGKLHWWKKTTRVGENYQCEIPEGLSSYDDTPPYQNKDVLVWQNDRLSESETAEYLAEYAHILDDGAVASKDGVIDNEQALYLLLQCGYNREEALRRTRLNGVAPADVMSLWSEEEVRGFETGLKMYGKHFHTIKQHKVGTRSVGELVQFYYLWKKSDKQEKFVDSFQENQASCVQVERRVTL